MGSKSEEEIRIDISLVEDGYDLEIRIKNNVESGTLINSMEIRDVTDAYPE